MSDEPTIDLATWEESLAVQARLIEAIRATGLASQVTSVRTANYCRDIDITLYGSGAELATLLGLEEIPERQRVTDQRDGRHLRWHSYGGTRDGWVIEVVGYEELPALDAPEAGAEGDR